MSTSSLLQSLQQAWVHSHEEDSPGQTVYRPASYGFPPSRGRMGFELLPDQLLRTTGIGAADGPSAAEGSWQLEQQGNSAMLHLAPAEQPAKLLHIISAAPDRLVLKA